MMMVIVLDILEYRAMIKQNEHIKKQTFFLLLKVSCLCTRQTDYCFKTFIYICDRLTLLDDRQRHEQLFRSLAWYTKKTMMIFNTSINSYYNSENYILHIICSVCVIKLNVLSMKRLRNKGDWNFTVFDWYRKKNGEEDLKHSKT